VWIDAVGGFLVCLDDNVSLGQAVPGTPVAVPIAGDVSRRHAAIRRADGAYLVTPYHDLRVAGNRVTGPTALCDGDELELGSRVTLRFRQPHALSASARLEMLSNHRIQPPCDGVLLMADACILGPGPNSHVVCRHWSTDLVLFRRRDQLHIRSPHAVEVDGVPCEGTSRVRRDSRICGPDFCLSLEPVG
jgi:hypothetical protein